MASFSTSTDNMAVVTSAVQAAGSVAAADIPTIATIYTSCDKLYIVLQPRDPRSPLRRVARTSSDACASPSPTSTTTTRVRAVGPTSTRTSVVSDPTTATTTTATTITSLDFSTVGMPSSPTSTWTSVISDPTTATTTTSSDFSTVDMPSSPTATPSNISLDKDKAAPSKGLTTAEMAGVAGVVLAAFALIALAIALFRCRQWRQRDESLWSILFSDKYKDVNMTIPYWEESCARRGRYAHPPSIHYGPGRVNDAFDIMGCRLQSESGRPVLSRTSSSAPRISPLALGSEREESPSSFARMFMTSDGGWSRL